MNLAAYLLLFVVVGVGFILVHLLIGKIIRPSTPGAEKGTIYECGEPTIGSAWVQFDLRFYVVALLFVIFDVEVAFFFPWAEVFGKANTVAAWQNVPQGRELTEYGRAARDLMPNSPANTQIRDLYENLGAAQPKPPSDLEAEQVGQFQDVARLFEEARRKYDADMRQYEGEVARLRDQNAAEELARLKPPVAPSIATMFPKLTPEQRTQFEARLRFDQQMARDFEANRRTARTLAVLALGEIVVFFGVLLVGFAYLWRRGDLEWVRSLAERSGKPTAASLPLPMAPVKTAPAPPMAPAATAHAL
jgi:NADH:ubiquinone oxidoreductase subunit 3 (subunit A)